MQAAALESRRRVRVTLRMTLERPGLTRHGWPSVSCVNLDSGEGVHGNFCEVAGRVEWRGVAGPLDLPEDDRHGHLRTRPDAVIGSIGALRRQLAYGWAADWSSLTAWVVWVRV